MLMFILPFLQAISALITVWGFCNAPEASDVVVKYGAFGSEGLSPMEWINSFGSIVLGAGGWISTYLFQKSKLSNLGLAIAAWTTNRKDPIAILKVALAAMDWLEEIVVPLFPNSDMSLWFKTTIEGLREQLVKIPLVNKPPIVPQTV